LLNPRKFALFLRGKGERKAHTYDMGCSRQLCPARWKFSPLGRKVLLMNRAFISIVLLLVVAVSSAAQRKHKVFPVPPEMHEFVSGAARTHSAAEESLLRAAVESDLIKTDGECDEKNRATFADAQIEELPKQYFGRAFLVRIPNSCVCGANSNCPIFAYVRGKTGFRSVLMDDGWGYAVTMSKTLGPGIAVAGKMGETRLTLFSFQKGRFVAVGCDSVSPRGGNWTRWWNPTEMIVRPCE
jgi:hypothetical protein